MILREQLVASMKKLNRIMKADNAEGHQWRYYNSKRSEPTFQATRAAGKYYTNCMGGVSFACKDAGIPASALQWYGGQNKIVWLGDRDKSKANAKKVFDIFRIRDRTVRTCIRKGILQPGDIITYKNMTHTNALYSTEKSFDSGHAYCTGSGEGAKYNKWIGSVAHGGSKVAYIFRLKGDYTYRVQVGAYTSISNAQRRMAEVAQASGLGCFMEQTDCIRVYCGSFSIFTNAVDRLDDLQNHGITDAHITAK